MGVTGTASIVAEKTDSISFTVTGEDADGNSVKATSSPVSITVQEVDPATAIGMDIRYSNAYAYQGGAG